MSVCVMFGIRVRIRVRTIITMPPYKYISKTKMLVVPSSSHCFVLGSWRIKAMIMSDTTTTSASIKPSDSDPTSGASASQPVHVYVRRNKKAKGITITPTTKLQQNQLLPSTQTHKVTTFFIIASLFLMGHSWVSLSIFFSFLRFSQSFYLGSLNHEFLACPFVFFTVKFLACNVFNNFFLKCDLQWISYDSVLYICFCRSLVCLKLKTLHIKDQMNWLSAVSISLLKFVMLMLMHSPVSVFGVVLIRQRSKHVDGRISLTAGNLP